MILEHDIAGRQELGSRSRQEDDYAFCEFLDEDGTGGLLLVLADGLGGHQAGQVASQCAVRGAIEGFMGSRGPAADRLTAAFHAANQAIRQSIEARPENRGMGSTMVAFCLTRSGLDYLSVGDSKLYHLRSGKLLRLNHDQTMASYFDELAASGRLSHEEARNHPERKSLRMALQGEPLGIEDRSKATLAMEAGDMILAASDGITTLSEERIAEILRAGRELPAGAILGGLLGELTAVGRINQDNTTVALVKFADNWQESLFLRSAED